MKKVKKYYVFQGYLEERLLESLKGCEASLEDFVSDNFSEDDYWHLRAASIRVAEVGEVGEGYPNLKYIVINDSDTFWKLIYTEEDGSINLDGSIYHRVVPVERVVVDYVWEGE